MRNDWRYGSAKDARLPAQRTRTSWMAPGCALLVLLVTFAVPREANAHAVGISRGEYQLSGAELEVTLQFARPEIVAAVPVLDTNGDGSISALELQTGHQLLDQAIVKRLNAANDAGGCIGRLREADLIEGDGLLIRATYRCPETAAASYTGQPSTSDRVSRITVSLDLLEGLSHGHRHLATVGEGSSARHLVSYSGHQQFEVSATSLGDPDAGFYGVAASLCRLGIAHILTGYDHLAFLLGLILIGGRFRSILLALTAFTVAHSITLALSVLDVWSPGATFVEPAIALSIVYVGVENWFGTSGDRRWLVTFPFGLIHGFGFAGALREISLPHAEVPVALAAFNGGVEIGQIAVLLLVLPTLVWLRRQHWFADQGAKVASTGIACAGLAWFIARVV